MGSPPAPGPPLPATALRRPGEIPGIWNGSAGCMAARLAGRWPHMLAFIIVLLIVGLIAGAVARLLVPGRDPIGLLGTILLGVAGSFLGGIVLNLIEYHKLFTHSVRVAGVIGSIIGALILLIILRLSGHERGRSRSRYSRRSSRRRRWI
jgi:uncharacterized membrane protein YeaQ/YmgE (transglycosylase-associated protein family)